jgi:hypothetical protein
METGTPKFHLRDPGIVNHGVEVDEVANYNYIYIKGGPDIKVEVRIPGVTFQGLYIEGGSIYIGILV